MELLAQWDTLAGDAWRKGDAEMERYYYGVMFGMERAREERPRLPVDLEHHLNLAQCAPVGVLLAPEVGLPELLRGDEAQFPCHRVALEGTLDLELVAARQLEDDGPAGRVSDDHGRLSRAHSYLRGV